MHQLGVLPLAATHGPRRAFERAESNLALVIDFTADGKAIGIEITTPAKVSLAALNAVLRELGHALASEADLAPKPRGMRFRTERSA